jgi:hypothetical protein
VLNGSLEIAKLILMRDLEKLSVICCETQGELESFRFSSSARRNQLMIETLLRARLLVRKEFGLSELYVTSTGRGRQFLTCGLHLRVFVAL